MTVISIDYQSLATHARLRWLLLRKLQLLRLLLQLLRLLLLMLQIVVHLSAALTTLPVLPPLGNFLHDFLQADLFGRVEAPLAGQSLDVFDADAFSFVRFLLGGVEGGDLYLGKLRFFALRLLLLGKHWLLRCFYSLQLWLFFCFLFRIIHFLNGYLYLLLGLLLVALPASLLFCLIQQQVGVRILLRIIDSESLLLRG